MREQLIKALLAHANGEIQMHLANVEVYLNNPVGIGEHSDLVDEVCGFVDRLAHAHDKLDMVSTLIKNFTSEQKVQDVEYTFE